MKVLILNKVSNIGDVGEIKNVSSGYARNFLIPKGFARIATSRDVKDFEKMSEENALKKEKNIEIKKKSASEIRKKTLSFVLKAGSVGKAFGSIGKSDISEALCKEGYVDFSVVLNKPLKEFGVSEVAIDFGDGIKSTVSVNIKKE
jgi:large subunit ribosomal protein L9